MSIFSNVIVPHPPPYEEDGDGLNYAKELAEKTQGLSFWLVISGWFFVVLGALCAISGSVLGADHSNTSSEFWSVLQAQRGLIFSVFGVVSAGIGWQVLDRASSAAKLTSIATRAILKAKIIDSAGSEPNDKLAYQACVFGKASWLEGRMNHERLESIANNLSKSSNSKGGIEPSEQN